MNSVKRESIAILAVCLVMGGYVIFACQQFPQAHGSQGFGQGPGFYPQVLAWSMILLGILNFLSGLNKRNSRIGKEAGGGSEPADRPRYFLVGTIFVLTVVDVIIMNYFGFFIAGLLLVMAAVLLIRPCFRPVSLIRDALFSAAMVLTVYLVFEVFISIQLPRGLFLE